MSTFWKGHVAPGSSASLISVQTVDLNLLELGTGYSRPRMSPLPPLSFPGTIGLLILSPCISLPEGDLSVK